MGMTQISIRYQGHKHCDLTHGPSKARLETDAPKDNQGKGEAFSPTDLVAAALASCMLTVMAIEAEKTGLSLEGAHGEITKEMAAGPRRIVGLPARVHLPKALQPEDRKRLEDIARGCPVARSIHPDIRAVVEFVYDV